MTAIRQIDPEPSGWNGMHLAALLIANLSIGIGPLFIRMADAGPAATGFWRHVIALPILAALLIWREPASEWRLRGRTLWIVLGAGALFGLNLVCAYIGFGLTRMGNIALLGNSGGLLLMAWGVIALRRLPRVLEVAALGSAIIGVAMLLAGSLEVSVETFRGDLLGLASGACYAAYLLMLRHARALIGQITLLFWATIGSTPLLLFMALAMGEKLLPDNWWPIVALTISGHLVGQTLLIYSLRHFSALVIGITLLSQPAIAAALGWIVYGEVLSALDMVGMAMVGVALVISRAADQPAPKAIVSEITPVGEPEAAKSKEPA